MADASSNKSRRIVSIQVCRGLAALLVVLAHLRSVELKYCSTHLMDIFQHGVLGVDLFFVISGVVISSVAAGRFKSPGNALSFLYHRFARIFPIYWIYTTLILVANQFSSLRVAAAGPHQANILASYLLIPTHRIMILLQGWTLSYEIYFYLVFFLLLLCVSERTAGWLLIAWGIAVVTLKLYLGYSMQPLVQLLTNPLVLEFLAGCVIFHIYRRARLHRLTGIFLILAAILWLTAVIAYKAHAHPWNNTLIENLPWTRPALYGTFSALFLFGAMELERSSLIRYFHFLESIGDWSYSIYLTHLIVIEIFGRIAYHYARHLHYSILIIDLVSLPAVLLAGYLSYRYLEKPLMTLLYRPTPTPT